MKDSRPTVTLELVLYAVLLAVAAWLRFDRLDRQPLADGEAAEALAALSRPSPFQPADPPRGSPAYVVLTGAVFALTGPGDGPARWIPALAGTALLLTPLLIRRVVGRGTAFTATLLLAVSPTLWAASRTAGGTALAALGVLAGVLFLARARSHPQPNLEWAAGMLALTVASGRAGLIGLATVAVGGAISLYLFRRGGNPHSRGSGVFPLFSDLSAEQRRRLLWIVGLVGLGLATGFGLNLPALGGLVEGLGAWISGWVPYGGAPAATVLLQLPAYEPLLLVFGGLGLIAAFRRGSDLDRWLAAWAIGALLWLVIYGGRQPEDVLWAVLPLSLLAAREVAARLDQVFQAPPGWLTIGFTGAVLALTAFSYLQFEAWLRNPNAQQVLLGVPLLLTVGLMGAGLAVAVVLLLAVGWTVGAARAVANLAALVVLFNLTVSAGSRLNLAEVSARELWRPQVSSPGLRGLVRTLDRISTAQTGRSGALAIRLADPATPALAWALREYSPDRGSDPGSRVPVLLMEEASAAGAVPGEYLGQSVTIGERWGWSGWFPERLGAWWITGAAPTLPERWVLWVRPDVAGVEPSAPGDGP